MRAIVVDHGMIRLGRTGVQSCPADYASCRAAFLRRSACHACADRLSHPYRAWRQSRPRVRDAPERCELRGSRPRRRRHRFDGFAPRAAKARRSCWNRRLVRADALIAEGVSTIEVKSGYGLDCDTELKMLRVARAIGRMRPVTIVHQLSRGPCGTGGGGCR